MNPPQPTIRIPEFQEQEQMSQAEPTVVVNEDFTPGTAMTYLAKSVRKPLASLFVVGAALLLTDCSMIRKQFSSTPAAVEFQKGNVDSARDAFEKGYYLESRDSYDYVPKNQLTEQDLKNIETINVEIEEMIRTNFGLITEKTKNKPEDNDYYGALEACKELKRLIKTGDKRLEIVTKVEQKVMQQISFLSEEYRGQYKTLVELLEPYKLLTKRLMGISAPLREEAVKKFLFSDQSLSTEDWKDVKNMFERLRLLRIKIRREDRSLTPLALDYVNAFNFIGDFERAAIAYSLADNVQLKEGEFQDEGQLNRQERRRRKAIDRRAEKQRAKNEKKVQSIERIFIAKRYDSATQKANDALSNAELRLNNMHRERLEFVLEKIANGNKRKNRWRPRKKVAKVVPTPANGSAKTATDAAPAVAIPEEGYDKIEVTKILRELSAAYKAGNHFEAIVSLEEAIAAFRGVKQQKPLLKQQKRWNPTRNSLIKSYMAKADGLFEEEDENAIKWYQKVLELNPDSTDVRKKAREARDTLRDIMKD